MKVWIVAVLLSVLIAVVVGDMVSKDHLGHSYSVYDVDYEQVFLCLGEHWDPFDATRTLQQEINMLKFCVIADPHSR